MARSKKGTWSKLLNFVGIVDDEIPVDDYEEDRGRPSTYVPSHDRPSTRQRTNRDMVRRGEPARQPVRSVSNDRRYDPTRPTPRPAARDTVRPSAPTPRRSAFVERVDDRRQGYDYTPRPSRFGGLEDEPRDRRNADRGDTRRRGARNRTMTFTLQDLADCSDVIDELLANNTVVITLDGLDPMLMQRSVDTLSGAVFALHASIQRVSQQSNTYVIAPSSVEVNELYREDDFGY